MTTEVPTNGNVHHEAEARQLYPLSDLRDEGLLWLLNTTALHPRGYAVAFEYAPLAEDDDPDAKREAIGWVIIGDGKEPWTFGDDVDAPFEAVERLLARAREEALTNVPGGANETGAAS